MFKIYKLTMFLASETLWWKLSWMENNSFSPLEKYFGQSFTFHTRLSFDCKLLIKFSEFYKNILFQCSSTFFSFSKLLSCILSKLLWFKKHILIEVNLISFFLWQRPKLATMFDNPWRYSSSFQYKILNNVLYLNKKTFYVSKIDFTSLSFLQTFLEYSGPSILKM